MCVFACAVQSLASAGPAADRPMGWLADDRSTMASSVRTVLRLANTHRTPDEMTPKELTPIYLDAGSSFRVSDDRAFRSRAFEVLDAVISAERKLDSGWKCADPANDRQAAAYYFLKYRLRFAQSLPKIEIARRMAETGSSSYCMQAMESAIDCLKASAESRDSFERLRGAQKYRSVGDLSPGTIRKFRENLLRAWHSSKSLGSLTPIREIDLAGELNKAVMQSVKGKEAQAQVMSLFDWLRPAAVGNHPDPEPVE